MTTTYYRFVVKRDTAANFTAANTLLLSGEWALETDTRKMKMGDGVTPWITLAYFTTANVPEHASNLYYTDERVQDATAAMLAGTHTGISFVYDDIAGTITATVSGGGGGSPSHAIVASEALAANDIVNIWNDAGTAKVRKADATAEGKEAQGFVLAAFAAAASATVYFSGKHTGLTGLTPGAVRYLSTTPGLSSASFPTVVGNVYQVIGFAYDTTGMHFAPQAPVTLT